MDYKEYRCTRQEWFFMLAKALAGSMVIAVLFYNSLWAMLLPLAGIKFYIQNQKKQLCFRRKQQIRVEFKEMIQSIATGLHAGYALENTFSMAKADLKRIYPRGSYLETECDYMIHSLQLHRSVAELLQELASRTQVEEIQVFSQIVAVAQRSGGNLLQIIQNAVRQIAGSIEVEREISVLTAAKVLEAKIMTGMPFLIVGYLRISNPGYLDVLYQSIAGRLFMSVVLVVIFAAERMARKIVRITV